MALVAVMTFLGTFALARAVFAPGPVLKAAWARLERIRPSRLEGAAPADPELLAPLGERLLGPWLRALGDRLYALTPLGWKRRLDLRLLRAGRRGQADRLLGTAAVLAVGGPLAWAVTGGSAHLGWLPAMLLAAVGGALPDLWLGRQLVRRQRTIRAQLPDVLDLLCVSVQAGLAFDGALQRIAERFRGPVGAELGVYLREVMLGKSRAGALRGLAHRTGVAELGTFAAALIQADQLGVPIAGVLRIQADQLRVARKQEVQEEAMRIPIKLLFPLVFFIFPAVFVVVLGPALISYLKVLAP